MVESTQRKIKVSTISLKDDWTYAGYSVEMSQKEYDSMKGDDGKQVK